MENPRYARAPILGAVHDRHGTGCRPRQGTHGEKRLDEKLLALSKAKLLIVDELGNLPLEPDAAHLFFQLVSRRYETGAMLITSNRSVAE
jgi:DNA replication protein DnaC